MQYDNHLSFAHRSGLVVKHLSSTVPVNSFHFWKTNCIEIVAFYESGNPTEFLYDLSNWGYHGNVVMYAVFTNSNQHRSDLLPYLCTFYAPIYIIVLKFGGDLIRVHTGVLHPTRFTPLRKWGIIRSLNGEVQGSGG
ncbi:hypothetical protein Fcan01_16645 [Folsomia candida]|uniref:Uncharacterized protein n=1 Tax=Folsomia candida TaxID=158441 RepID=A0A226DWI8_FOLCA|nr:hypothetical protein Fcan01_16645 [Folsomia candida]